MRETPASVLERMLTEAGATFENVINMEKVEEKEKDQIVEYAKKELELAGFFDKDSDYDGMLGESVMEIMKVFSKQEHSGVSAGITINIVEKLMRFQPLTPLTNNPKEWMEVGEQMWQSTRRPDAFSENGGKTYYILDEDEKNGKKIYHNTALWESKK